MPPTAEPASAAAPSSVSASRNRSRRKRSPSDAANGAMIAAGSSRTSPATPTAAVPPCSYANTPSATKCIHSDAIAAPQASSTRRTSRLLAAVPSAETTCLGLIIRRFNRLVRGRYKRSSQMRGSTSSSGSPACSCSRSRSASAVSSGRRSRNVSTTWWLGSTREEERDVQQLGEHRRAARRAAPPRPWGSPARCRPPRSGARSASTRRRRRRSPRTRRGRSSTATRRRCTARTARASSRACSRSSAGPSRGCTSALISACATREPKICPRGATRRTCGSGRARGRCRPRR